MRIQHKYTYDAKLFFTRLDFVTVMIEKTFSRCKN
jgi:hypothetical protein